MAEFFNEQARYFQDKLGTRALADRIHNFVVHDRLTEEEVAFIESRDFFYISTVDGDGFPQCSYKGGARGFVKVVDDNTFNHLYAGELVRLVPNSLIVHMYRDPRDVVASYIKQRWSPTELDQSIDYYCSIMQKWSEIRGTIPAEKF